MKQLSDHQVLNKLKAIITLAEEVGKDLWEREELSQEILTQLIHLSNCEPLSRMQITGLFEEEWRFELYDLFNNQGEE